MKLTTVRAYTKTRDAISKESKKMGKLGSQQEVLEKWRINNRKYLRLMAQNKSRV